MGWVCRLFGTDYFIYDEKYQYAQNYQFLGSYTFCGIRNNAADLLPNYYYKWIYFNGKYLLFDV